MLLSSHRKTSYHIVCWVSWVRFGKEELIERSLRELAAFMNIKEHQRGKGSRKDRKRRESRKDVTRWHNGGVRPGTTQILTEMTWCSDVCRLSSCCCFVRKNVVFVERKKTGWHRGKIEMTRERKSVLDTLSIQSCDKDTEKREVHGDVRRGRDG